MLLYHYLLTFNYLLLWYKNSIVFCQNLDGDIFNGWNSKKRKTTVDSKKDLVQPNEKHLAGIPKFLQQPKPYYYVSKSRPAIVTCIAEPVSHVNIFCADKEYTYMNEAVSASGLRVDKLNGSNEPDKNGIRWRFSFEVKQKEVVEWFSEYKCYCEAWNLIEQLQQVKKVVSDKAIIYDAYFNTDFKKTPKSQSIIEGENLKLTCIPPDAKPPAEIYWSVNGQRILETSATKINPLDKSPQINNNNINNNNNKKHITINDYRQLVIVSITKSDTGNYSCIAKSLDTIRISTAQILVIKSGVWEPWSKWDKECPDECYAKTGTCPSKCSNIFRRRSRVCNNQDNNKERITKCLGDSSEMKSCDLCSSEMWTFWSEWGPCIGKPCQKHRTRQCIISSKCDKQIYTQTINCTDNIQCEKSSSIGVDSKIKDKSIKNEETKLTTHDITMYVGLFVAIAVFTMVIIVVFCLIKRKIIGFSPARVWRYSNSTNGMPLFYSDKNMKKEFSNLSSNKQMNILDVNGGVQSNQPSIYRSMVLPNSLPYLSGQTQQTPLSNSTSGNTQIPQPPHHHQSVDAITSGVYTDVMLTNSTNHLANLGTGPQNHLHNDLNSPNTAYYSATPLISGPNHNTQSMMRPSYSDSKVASVLNPNFNHIGNGNPAYPYLHQYPAPTIGFIGPQCAPQSGGLLKHHISTLPILPPSLSAASRPSSEHYQELGTNTDLDDEDDDDDVDGNCKNCDEQNALCNKQHKNKMKNDAGVNLLLTNNNNNDNNLHHHHRQLPSHQITTNNNNNNNQMSIVYEITELYPNEQICWASLNTPSPTSISSLSHTSIRLNIPQLDISLTCPSNPLPVDKSETVFLLTSSSDQDLPALNENETLLSPIIVCGPGSLVVNKPFILSIPHCAMINMSSTSSSSSSQLSTVPKQHNTTNTTSTSLTSSANSSITSGTGTAGSNHNVGEPNNCSQWSMTVLTSYSLLTQKPYWQKFVELPINTQTEDSNNNNNNPTRCSNPSGYAHLMKDRVLLMTTQLQRFCIVGCNVKSIIPRNISNSNQSLIPVVKSMKIVVYSTGLHHQQHQNINSLRYHHHHNHHRAAQSSEVIIRIYILPDFNDSLIRIHNEETEKLGARLVTMMTTTMDEQQQQQQQQRVCNNKKKNCHFPLQDDGGNLNISITDLSPEWQACVTNKTQEIPFQTVWHSSNFHCSFTFVKRTTTGPSSTSSSSLSSSSTDKTVAPISATKLLQQQQQQQQQQQNNDNWYCSLTIQQNNCIQHQQHITLSSSRSASSSSTSSSISSSNTSTSYPPPHPPINNNNTPYFVDDCYNNSNKSCTDAQLKELASFRIPEATKLKLSKLLDPPSPVDNDWRQLAHFLSVKRSLQFFANKPSPTEALLDLLEEVVSNNNASKINTSTILSSQIHLYNKLNQSIIQQLIELFRNTGRLDCATILKNDMIMMFTATE